MSGERRDTAKRLADEKYAATLKRDAGRERFMDSTASLRRIKPTIAACQNGEMAMAGKKYDQAEGQFRTALSQTPRDYAANLLMAQALQAQGKDSQALGYADTAKKIYPQEAQAHKLSGLLALGQKNPSAAYASLDQYDRMLPGDAGVTFLKGVSLEGMGRKQDAAQHYARYLNNNRQGKAAEYAYSRLRGWGYAKYSNIWADFREYRPRSACWCGELRCPRKRGPHPPVPGVIPVAGWVRPSSPCHACGE